MSTDPINSSTDSDGQDRKVIQLAKKAEAMILEDYINKGDKLGLYIVVHDGRYGMKFIAGFSSKQLAISYMIRREMNCAIDYYPQVVKMNKKKLSVSDFAESVTKSLQTKGEEHLGYAVKTIKNLDISKPIYVITGRMDKQVSKSAYRKQITNSLEVWQEAMEEYTKDDRILKRWTVDAWQKYCTLEINPSLPKLEKEMY